MGFAYWKKNKQTKQKKQRKCIFPAVVAHFQIEHQTFAVFAVDCLQCRVTDHSSAWVSCWKYPVTPTHVCSAVLPEADPGVNPVTLFHSHLMVRRQKFCTAQNWISKIAVTLKPPKHSALGFSSFRIHRLEKRSLLGVGWQTSTWVWINSAQTTRTCAACLQVFLWSAFLCELQQRYKLYLPSQRLFSSYLLIDLLLNTVSLNFEQPWPTSNTTLHLCEKKLIHMPVIHGIHHIHHSPLKVCQKYQAPKRKLRPIRQVLSQVSFMGFFLRMWRWVINETRTICGFQMSERSWDKFFAPCFTFWIVCFQSRPTKAGQSKKQSLTRDVDHKGPMSKRMRSRNSGMWVHVVNVGQTAAPAAAPSAPSSCSYLSLTHLPSVFTFYMLAMFSPITSS